MVSSIAPGWVGETLRGSGASVGPFTTTETVVTSFTFTAVGVARYRVIAHQHVRSSVAGDTVQLRLRREAGGTLTTAGTQFDTINQGCLTTNLVAVLLGTFTNVSGQVTVGVTAARLSGTGNITMDGFSTAASKLLVERC
ncbi:hypothetical protein MED01_004282 [Micromonospora sp. MED01]|uniref:hypothetical protein n=1 Tax=Micromonospora alfalfae TaxID=2911212 RepID=UPI001EE973F3|nr:hypothetical protein [Micromonospora alfalfae]MCG5460856.1 hypothetical protein [Micromonospora alfalfae]